MLYLSEAYFLNIFKFSKFKTDYEKKDNFILNGYGSILGL